MLRKTARMTSREIQTPPLVKPVVYKIFDNIGENIYTGMAGRGNVHDRIKDHLPGKRATLF